MRTKSAVALAPTMAPVTMVAVAEIMAHAPMDHVVVPAMAPVVVVKESILSAEAPSPLAGLFNPLHSRV